MRQYRPVLGIGGAHSLGEQVAHTMKLAAGDVQAACIQIFSKEFGTYADPGFIESVLLANPGRGS